ncbi:hypothetical protein [Halarcobacter anaerophilus]|uniref:Lipoprotein n=1 Tax=Halarcobacter anaerophilus TaxID=877500 RepID=A0A4Q0Y6B9_9BACT|nr:hypothetical protein [Halarcobacter anaerophilus]QDF29154.1 hypothetical protein AANAER_1678 [Halarcobacter anaerophilus]RXJ64409.1 hypothetical protein CRV06_00175 [Halarcobacter anaerophilus]
MRKIVYSTLFLVFIIGSFTGCSLRSEELVELKPDLKNLTKRANSAIERRGIPQAEVKVFLNKNYPILMENFKDYDIQIKYENSVTVVLVCQENRALFEDLSCDIRIDYDYTNENLQCAFYVKNPSCEE